MIQKEIIQLLRDWRTLAMMLLLPLIMLFLFAYAVKLTVDHIPTAVADMSVDAESHAFVDALVVSGFFDMALYVDDEAQVIAAIDEGRAMAGLVIPPDFAAQVERGQAQALFLIDGSNSFVVQSGYSAAAAIAQARSTELLMRKVDQMGMATAGFDSLPITTSIRVLYNPNMDGMVFAIPAIAAMLLQFVALNTTAMAVVREHELRTIEQLLVTPVRPIELIIGKMVPNVVLTLVDMIIIVLVGVYWFGVPFRGDPWLFAWLSLIFVVSGLALGLLTSTVAKTQNEAQQITMVLVLLSVLLTGFIYPIAPMPPAVKAVSYMIPLTYFNRIVRGVFTKGVGLSFLWQDVAVLLVYGTVAMVAAAVMFKKRLD
jgi:ABC-2 type transport system permease protein